MHPTFRAALLLLAACGSAAPDALHELPGFHGELRFTPAGGQPQRVELAFERAAGHLQVTRRGDVTVALLRAADGRLLAFRDGVPAVAAAEDEALLAAVERLAHAPPETPREAVPGGYRLRLPGEVVEVQLTPRRAHGSR